VTICTYEKECMFGVIENEEMKLNLEGKIADKCWSKIPELYDNVELDEFIIMPNHVHGIIMIKPVGVEYIQPLRNKYQHVIPNSLGSIIRSYKAAVARECRKKCSSYFGWQRDFYEHIIHTDKELTNIRKYITENVLKWSLDDENLEKSLL
jgi:putative transposase